MGEVYLCLDLQEDYPYALKTFQQHYQSATLRKAFEQEVATWVALEKHPNIVRCFHMDTLDNQPFMVLEWIAGEEGKGADLRGWLRPGPLELQTALEIIIDVVRGLIHAQEKQPGLVHRDLKPENILVVQGGLAKITDFGLAQIVAQARLELEAEAKVERRQSLVRKGGIAGTPAYMAPEQWRGEPLDERTDIYAVGCILYEMLTGEWPFQIDFVPATPQRFQQWLKAMQAMHESHPVPILSAIPTALSDLLSSCLAKTQAERLTSLTDLSARLVYLYQQQYDQTPPSRPTPGEFTAVDYNNRGATFLELKQFEVALTDFKRAIELDPHDAKTYANRGATYHQLQQYNLAFEDYSQAIEIAPNFAGTYINRGTTYKELQQYTLAIEDYSQAIELDPNLALAYTYRGASYKALQQYKASIADYNRAIKLDPNLALAYNNRGDTFRELQEYEAALSDFTRSIELNPDDSIAYYNRGLTYHTLQQYELALKDHAQTIELNPTDAIAYVNQGSSYAALEKYKFAVESYNRAIKLDPGLAIAYANRATTYKIQQQFESALLDYSQALKLDPHLADTHLNRGLIYDQLQQPKEALADYGRAITLNPNLTEAYIKRGNILLGSQQPEEAIADFRQAITLEPNLAEAYLGIAIGFMDQGMVNEALPHLEKAEQLGDPKIREVVGQFMQMLDMTPISPDDSAQQAFELFQQANSPKAMYQAISQHPIMTDPQFIAAIEQAIAEQVAPEDRPYFEERLGWLRQAKDEG